MSDAAPDSGLRMYNEALSLHLRYGLDIALSTLNSCRYLHDPKTRFPVEWLVPFPGRESHPLKAPGLTWRTEEGLKVYDKQNARAHQARRSDTGQNIDYSGDRQIRHPGVAYWPPCSYSVNLLVTDVTPCTPCAALVATCSCFGSMIMPVSITLPVLAVARAEISASPRLFDL